MKRIIQCQNCDSKLSVFDIGKPINQKCPKCGTAISIESEAATSDDKNKEDDKAAPAAASSASSDKPASTDKPANSGKASEAAAGGDGTADKPKEKKVQPDKTPALSSDTAEVLPQHDQSGGGLFKVVVIGALIVIIAMQVIAKIRADKQYNVLNGNLKTIANMIGK